MRYSKLVLMITVLMLLGMTNVSAQTTVAPHPMPAYPWAGQQMPMHPGVWMNPQYYMQWMMNPWSAHPHGYGAWMQPANPFVDQMTRHRMLDSMMRSFDPQMFPKAHQWRIPGFPTQTKRDLKPNTVSEAVSTEAKRHFYQSMMMTNPLSMRDMVSIMADKMPVADEVSFDDAVESMRLRANEINFKFVGHNPLWKDIEAITGEKTPRVEIFQFCDAMVGRQILDYVPEFVVFLPCRIALLEDAEGKLWIMTLDWDVNWLDYAQNPNSELDAELRANARRIRDGIRYIMEGAATGDF